MYQRRGKSDLYFKKLLEENIKIYYCRKKSVSFPRGLKVALELIIFKLDIYFLVHCFMNV